MGIAGCGKSSVGAALAAGLSATFIDGDDLHPKSNIEKMARGEALNDTDRAPWLEKVGTALRDFDGLCVIGCSALKRSYRNRIRDAAGEPVLFLHLDGAAEVIRKRMSARDDHFMPLSLLDSQIATLQPLQPDEASVTVDIDQSFDAVVAEILEKIGKVET